jgi:hypothetical protein
VGLREWLAGFGILTLAAIVGLTVAVSYGMAVLAVTLPDVLAAFPAAGTWAIDGHRHFLAAEAVVAGANPYTLEGFYYSPLGALSVAPLAALGPDRGIWLWMAIKLVVLVWCLLDATRGATAPVRAGVLLLGLSSIFVLDDLLLGNVAIVLAAAIYLAVSRPAPVAAIPLGLLLALVAKPFLVPFLLWMLVFRRSSALVAVGTGILATIVGVALLGLDDYRAYLESLVAAGRTAVPFVGNHGLTSIAPALLIPATIVLFAIFGVLLWRSRDETSLLMWSLFAGLVAAPYVGLYAAVPVFAGVPAFARAHPGRVRVMAALLLPVSLLSVEAAAILGLVVAFPADLLDPLVERLRSVTGATPHARDGA